MRPHITVISTHHRIRVRSTTTASHTSPLFGQLLVIITSPFALSTKPIYSFPQVSLQPSSDTQCSLRRHCSRRIRTFRIPGFRLDLSNTSIVPRTPLPLTPLDLSAELCARFVMPNEIPNPQGFSPAFSKPESTLTFPCFALCRSPVPPHSYHLISSHSSLPFPSYAPAQGGPGKRISYRGSENIFRTSSRNLPTST